MGPPLFGAWDIVVSEVFIGHCVAKRQGNLHILRDGTLWDILGHLAIWITDGGERLQKVSHSVSLCLAGGQGCEQGRYSLVKESAGPQRQVGEERGKC